MPTADYGPLQYIGSIVPTVSGTAVQIPYIATSVRFSNGGSLVPIILYKQTGYSTNPIRYCTHVPVWGTGDISISGIFSAAAGGSVCANAMAVLENMSGAYIQELQFTLAPAPRTGQPSYSTTIVYYCRHVIPNVIGLTPADFNGVSVMSGTLSMVCGHIITSDHPRFSSSEYDMPLTT